MPSTALFLSPALQRARWLCALLFLVSGILWSTQERLSNIVIHHALPLHMLLETITIIIFTSVFIVCWNAFGEVRKISSVILAVAFLCAAVLGLLHAISFRGMPGFDSATDMHKSLSFWLASRAIIAATLLGLALDPQDSEISERHSNTLLLVGVTITACWAGVIFSFPSLIPLTYLEGYGQTSFKLSCEAGLIGANGLSAILFYRHALRFGRQQIAEHLHIDRTPLLLASAMMALSEVYFSLYARASEIDVVIGHVLQLCAAVAIYRSMVAVNIHKPYASLAQTTARLANSARELSLQRERLSRMIDTAIDGIITVDDQQNIVLVNPAAAFIFGYTVEALTGSSLDRLIPPRHRHTHADHVQQFGAAGVTRRKMGTHFEDFYVTGCRADGKEFPLEASIAHQLEDGKRYYTVIFRDVSERKIAKEKMAAYHDQLSLLSSTLQTIREEERKHIARELHDDLGQLLAALRMDLSLLQRDQQLTSRSGQTIHSMDQLILTAITTLRRIATDLRPRALDEGGLYFALQSLRKDFTQRHGIECELIADEEQLTLDDAHSTAIFRIVQESLTNVVRHAMASEVRIEFERTPSKLEFSISDNGKGIDEGDMRKTQSFGLVGMRERVKAMQGEFQINSRGSDGTSLRISLPMRNISANHEKID
ncbi:MULTISPECIES: MASE3 domain-containing protein [unclassified Undibacterium]|uniref:MASE3 domain-containing protein n=1 Tax=unclassified Undibacterium TaxID=2630295 RepID=UPI002AC925BC|nr:MULTISPECIES: MASE3 domain-containing protein [unclassified Undibacterium]MEB0139349.1 MASE3 domain-containing protein [Undibacterium sp. CCC2.1]MEB0172193.1 MASE3 domain-containing protein [Undibacterium sp. CCC1.1]MEB0176017.1 MASE3 domain-containing protein [Undibacterium sp. CCC3.4]MEB0215329.1 MASE3 domain-containing protein [Undibacterium sp. 5I2]WPX43405.1 MASE3 domain-containing protein [Undibacterium sp. CCC3.4]